jgi:isochorismate synthase
MKNLLEQIANQLKEGLPFVAYHKPESDLVEAFFQIDGYLRIDPELEGSGFVFAPFDKGDPVLFPVEECRRASQRYEELKVPLKEVGRQQDSSAHNDGARMRHLILVEKAIRHIHKGRASKLVVSRAEHITAPVDLVMCFQRLLSTYPRAFSYLWFHPEIGIWMGATPEILLQATDSAFRTIALAGTMVDVVDKDLEWGAKEKEEQQMVTEHIQKELMDFKLKAGKARTIKAGNLLHLRTDLEGELTSAHRLSEVVNKLHPTAAVCGLPRKESRSFILEQEGYDREYYTGFLGELRLPLESSKNNKNRSASQLFVNLRCAKILADQQQAVLFVGGGITASSQPEKEWEETVAKSLTMKKVLRDP